MVEGTSCRIAVQTDLTLAAANEFRADLRASARARVFERGTAESPSSIMPFEMLQKSA